MSKIVTVAVLVMATFSGVAQNAEWRACIEADWLLQEEHRSGMPKGEPTTQTDAAGACDGVINGEWGFHTASEKAPWWQVDLGETQRIARVVLWNRCDGCSGRNSRIQILLSDDGAAWRSVYEHDGSMFLGFTDKKPLDVALDESARFVRLQLPGIDFLHLDEVQVFGPAAPDTNLALHRSADQSSTSPWSADHHAPEPTDWRKRAREVMEHARALAVELNAEGVKVVDARQRLDALSARFDDGEGDHQLYLDARWVQRALQLRHPLMDFDALLFTKRVPGSFNHMSDQYYGWWSRPGGGLYILRGFREDDPRLTCFTEALGQVGSFLRPDLSYDGRRVLFAWCRHYPGLADEKNKLDKNNVPEDAFYHLFECNLDGTELRKLTHGKYDDFDGRYLPDGRIVFLSTRRGQFIQVGPASAQRTLEQDDLPDAYVRCGGGPERPVAVYTLHTMDTDGSNLCAISPFEMFEWTPSIADDGTILYSRWDYVDRDNMPYMSLWAINPDGTNARAVYANYTKAPHCTFEPRCVPGSRKIVFTGSGHHAQTMGSLVLLDPTVDIEGTNPIRRLTPEVVFPEIEGWPTAYFSNPWPLSERFYLVSWGCEDAPRQGQQMAMNRMGIYLLDVEGGLELLYRDSAISCRYPIPVRSRWKPPVLASAINRLGPQEGRFFVTDVYRGLKGIERGRVKALRVVAIPAKTHPTMNFPNMGLTRDDPGKCVLGTVRVEEDGSAFFRAPAGVAVFFQALDADGMALQTMRGATHVQPGQTLSCIGCHENRYQAPSLRRGGAVVRPPSKLVPGPEGSWPLRFDRLVHPVLERHCVCCHSPEGESARARALDLRVGKAYELLTGYGTPSLRDHVLASYHQGYSVEGACTAASSPLWHLLTRPGGHEGVELDADSRERLLTWLDTYAQRLGSFDKAQEQQLVALREKHADLLADRPQILNVAAVPEQ
ncbi:MAG TPA: hypothetical protein ENN80_01265 [Candidatus Hydrogenedentes bacterium]|nr:hypothetical protein [Candidatus Hydrogenedentota bacterium]